MKKSIKMFLLILLICPVLIFTACVPPPSYLITSSSSDPTWGRPSGNKTVEMEEGTEITLTVTENNATEHPFICWVKDYNTVYSLDKELPLSYTQETAGHYTAVFDDSSDKMLFAAFSSINFATVQQDNSNDDGNTGGDDGWSDNFSVKSVTTYSVATYTLKYSNSTSGSNNYNLLSEGEFEPNKGLTTDYKSVLYFGPLGNNVKYKFELTLVLKDSQGNETPYTIKFSQQEILNSSFTNGVCEISETLSGTNTAVTLKFEKLNKTLLAVPEE